MTYSSNPTMQSKKEEDRETTKKENKGLKGTVRCDYFTVVDTRADEIVLDYASLLKTTSTLWNT